jgi:membrane protein YqaA with SNARE-associated domain
MIQFLRTSFSREMTNQAVRSALDELASSRAALILAFVWGLAEATFFFIVPDVLLTLIACRKLRPALNATFAALAGALAGGAFMYAFGTREPDTAHVFLTHVPAITPALLTRVTGQISEGGLLALLLGPLKGIPYKIYAVEWGARRGTFIGFLLISVPARFVRFFLAALAARVIARLIQPLTHHRAVIETSILAAVWITFYTFYFARFG